MSLTDPVADLLTRIRNAVRSHHVKVDVPSSKLKLEIVKILQDEGYVGGYKLNEENGRPLLKVQLKYGPNDQPVISNLRRVSQPGCRVYIGRHQNPPRPRRPRHLHPQHPPRGHDRPPGPQARRRRRTPLRGLVAPLRPLPI